MPDVRLIDKAEVQRVVRRRTGELAAKEKEEARQWLRQARESGRAIELTLGSNERDETVKARYRIVAKEEKVRIRFQTAAQRTYHNRKGVEEKEAAVMIVVVE